MNTNEHYHLTRIWIFHREELISSPLSIISTMKHTPLELAHLQAGARMVNFAGWSLPIQYTSIQKEHDAVRKDVGIFDISHMGEIMVEGEGAASWLEMMLSNRVGKLTTGCSQYTLMLNEEGGVIDDLILYARGDQKFFLVVNAGQREEDMLWLTKHLPEDQSVFLEDQSDSWAALALQGPKSEELLEKIFPSINFPKRNHLLEINDARFAHLLLLARTGYTGEDGFEIFLSHHDAPHLWQQFLAAGAKPSGLGARDTLRLEMGYPLYGSDLLLTRTPLEANLQRFLSLEDPLKGNFYGREALQKQQADGISSRLTPLQLIKEGPPLRAHYSIYAEEQLIGKTSSGSLSPSLGVGIALAYLPLEYTQVGTTLQIEIRNKRYKATVVTLPFYKK